jgi:hypothetical protein
MTRIPAQRVRRRDVILLFALYPLGTFALMYTMGASPWYGLAHIVLTASIMTSFGISRVARVGRAIADDLDTRLDERQLALRNSAYLQSYRFVAALVLLGVIWIALGTDLGYWWIPTTWHEWNAIFWGLFIYLTLLPSAILAWREPDRHDELEFADA